MIQFNQAKLPLRWKIGQAEFTAEPWGQVVPELSDLQAEASRKRGVPIAALPVVPEVRAQARVDDEQAEASKSVLVQLQKQKQVAEGEAKQAKAYLEEALSDLTKEREARRRDAGAITALEQRIKDLELDKAASAKVISETTKSAADSEERAIRAEAGKPRGRKGKDQEAGA